MSKYNSGPKYERDTTDYAGMAKSIMDIYDKRDKEIKDRTDSMWSNLLAAGKGWGNYQYGSKAALEAEMNDALEAGDMAAAQDAYSRLQHNLYFTDKDDKLKAMKMNRVFGSKGPMVSVYDEDFEVI